MDDLANVFEIVNEAVSLRLTALVTAGPPKIVKNIKRLTKRDAIAAE
jgi:hypothetical protein